MCRERFMWNEITDNNDLQSYDGTLICASKLRWRSIDNSLGTNDFFVPNL